MPLMISTRGYGVQMDTFYRYICACTYVYYTLIRDSYIYVYILYICTYRTHVVKALYFYFLAVFMNIFDNNNITTTIIVILIQNYF